MTEHREPLRIAYLSGSPRISTADDAEVVGPRAHIVGLIAALREAGHTVDEYVLGDRLRRRRAARRDDGDRAPAGPTSVRRQLVVDAVRLASRLPVALAARRQLPGRYDVVYERYALFQQLGSGLRRRGGAWVIESNAVLSNEARSERGALVLQRLAGWLERRSYRRADLVVCISETLRDLLIREAGVSPDKVVVVPNGVDVERFRPDVTPAIRSGSDGELVVGFVGFVIERQGLDDLIHAVQRLRAEGLGVSALIVGDGPDRRALERLARDLGVDGAVRFVGQVPWSAVPSHIASFSVAYSGQRGVGGMPMYHSPLKIYEYLAMGRPVIASAHPDAVRTLVEPRAGWTFPAGDREALVEVLRGVVTDQRAEFDEWGDRARSQVMAEHTWTHRAELLLTEMEHRGLLR